jgi:hypothetical protein
MGTFLYGTEEARHGWYHPATSKEWLGEHSRDRGVDHRDRLI